MSTPDLRAALQQIRDLEPRPFAGIPADWGAQIAACEACQRYVNHPIQQGICNEHRQPIWARKQHNVGEERAMGWRMKDIARKALEAPQTPDITTLAQEIADDAAVLTIERYAERAEGHPRGVWNVGVVDLAEIEEGDIVDMIATDLKRAVVYLDARGRLLRPVQGQAHLVKIAEVAS